MLQKYHMSWHCCRWPILLPVSVAHSHRLIVVIKILFLIMNAVSNIAVDVNAIDFLKQLLAAGNTCCKSPASTWCRCFADGNNCCKALPLLDAVACCTATAAATSQQQMLQHCSHMLRCCCPHSASLFCCTSCLCLSPSPLIDCHLQTIILDFDSSKRLALLL